MIIAQFLIRNENVQYILHKSLHFYLKIELLAWNTHYSKQGHYQSFLHGSFAQRIFPLLCFYKISFHIYREWSTFLMHFSAFVHRYLKSHPPTPTPQLILIISHKMSNGFFHC